MACDMAEIYQHKPFFDYLVPPIETSANHTFLCKVLSVVNTPSNTDCNRDHLKHVTLPHFKRTTKSTTSDTDDSHWQLIQQTLSQPIKTCQEFATALSAYNDEVPEMIPFIHLFEKVYTNEERARFFDQTLPNIISLALQLPELVPENIPYLLKNTNACITISQEQIASLLANSFLCTFPSRQKISHRFPQVHFLKMFAAKGRRKCCMEKIKCIINYFERVFEKMPTGVVTFERQYIANENLPSWEELENKLGNVRVCVSADGGIEDADGLLQVDFANRFVGGGVLRTGCVQEEIRFITCPELIMSALFTEMLGNNDALIITGAETFSNYKGYGDSFQWNGNHVDETPRDQYGRRKCTIVAMNAANYHRKKEQYQPSAILRDLNKAFVGFYSNASQCPTAIATGNWGCGAYGGNVQLKFLIQLMACSAANRDLVYYTFGSESLRQQIQTMYSLLSSQQVTVAGLFKLLSLNALNTESPEQVFTFISDHLANH